MAECKRICCAVDLSEPSRLALEAASDLATRLDAELTLLHVNGLRWTAAGEAGVSPAELVARTTGEIGRQVSRWGSRIVGRPVCTTMLSGDPAEEIVSFLREQPADLLVMGTHTRTGVMRFLLGSVAEEVVRRCPCPVFVVRAPRIERRILGMGETVSAHLGVGTGEHHGLREIDAANASRDRA